MNHFANKKLQQIGAQFQRKSLENAVKSGFENGYAFGCLDGRIATLKDVLASIADASPEAKKVFEDEIAKWEAEKKKLLVEAQKPQ